MNPTPHIVSPVADFPSLKQILIPENLDEYRKAVDGMNKVYDLRNDATAPNMFENLNESLRQKPIPEFLNNVGFFGSSKWWLAIENGTLPTTMLAGKIAFVGIRLDEFQEEYEALEIAVGGQLIDVGPWGGLEVYADASNVILQSLQVDFPETHILLPSIWHAWLEIWVS